MLIADMAQSVERRLGKAEVTGSIPVISFNMQSAVHFVRHFFVCLYIEQCDKVIHQHYVKYVSRQSSLIEIIKGKNQDFLVNIYENSVKLLTFVIRMIQ